MASRAARNERDDDPPPGDDEIILDAGPAITAVDAETQIVENEDGTSDVVIGPEDIASLAPAKEHGANLAEHLDDQCLSEISQELLAALDQDWASGEGHRKAVEDGMKYLGLAYEEKTWPFPNSCGAYDPLLMEAVVRFQATARGELLPAAGPVLTEVVGTESDQVAEQAHRVREWFNYYLTEVATEYYDDSDAMFFKLACWGSVFRKVYVDPRLKRATAGTLTPDRFIVSYTTKDLASCPRSCELIDYTKRDMRTLQLNGFYRDVDLGETDEQEGTGEAAEGKKRDYLIGVKPDMAEGDDRHVVCEFHVDYDLPGFEHCDDDGPTGLPLPYVVSVEAYSRQVLAIRRNWQADDPDSAKLKHYVHHKMIPGEGFYGYGYIHLLGGSARVSTMLLRQSVDAGTLYNYPGGLRAKGSRLETNEIMMGPMQFAEIETGGLPIEQVIKPLPYRGPSEVTIALRDKVREEGRSLAANAEIAVGDGRQDAPVGTTVALLEQATKVQTAVMKRERVAFREEFRIFNRLFKENLPPTPYPFPVKGGQAVIMRSDFDDRIDVIPVADPNITSSSQKQMRSEAVYRMMMASPQHFDQRATIASVMEDMGYENVEKYLPPPQAAQPLDAVTENQYVIVGRPVTTAEWQDHASHIMVHQASIEAQGMLAHIQEHFAQKFRIDIQTAIGQQLPPLGQPLPPVVQNEISLLAAKAVATIKQQMAQQSPDPAAIALEQVKVEASKVQQKMAEATMKDATARYKADLDYKAKIGDLTVRDRATRFKTFVDLADNRNPVPGGAGQVWERR